MNDYLNKQPAVDARTGYEPINGYKHDDKSCAAETAYNRMLQQKMLDQKMYDEVAQRIECLGERPIHATLDISNSRLENTTDKLEYIKTVLFGESCGPDCHEALSNYSLRSQAGRTFDSSIKLERLCDEIIKRLLHE